MKNFLCKSMQLYIGYRDVKRERVREFDKWKEYGGFCVSVLGV